VHSSGSIPRRWSVADSREIYTVRQWGGRYFDVNEAGNLTACPAGTTTSGASGELPSGIDLKELVDEVRARGIGLPLLIRFPEILKSRIVDLNEAFKTAIVEYGYRGMYRGVYPIKVNQDRYVVDQIAQYGRPYHYGLEAGSKPELLAVLAMLDDEDALVVCNGYKDPEYVETALLGSKLGRKIILVVEKFSELKLIASLARRHGIRPTIGIRAKLATRGSGRWEASGGDRSKFGLSSR
jgi:arginine decarboxylase